MQLEEILYTKMQLKLTYKLYQKWKLYKTLATHKDAKLSIFLVLVV